MIRDGGTFEPKAYLTQYARQGVITHGHPMG